MMVVGACIFLIAAAQALPLFFGGAVAGFILGYCIFGFVAGLVLLVLAVAVGGVLIVMKQRKGLHSKKSDNGIFIYAYSKKV